MPPGPICNPSLDAIKAVLEPTKNSYVYFMAGDDGVMRYAKTLEEHNLNVAKYLK
ncbi:MAG TPA: endolytic transglycosylase MltG [Patescibacteria group bacterium]|nr:endolytic transglycosylase MltG [Patescibacteria group bacterium]